MPPNKPKLYKNTGSGKANPKPQKPVQNNVPVTQPGTSTTATEMPNQEQFEVELYWCIQQLQKALGSGKLNNKQDAANMKLQPATTNKKTVFLKKSLFASNVENSFKFNFSINENDTTEETVTVSDNQEQNSVTSEPFHFKPSNNGFRFNFDIENAPCDKTE
uniref:UPF0488 protein CG14286 isoform X2 n=1 Tax=Diabrotica virgifera virgifera TaxID=50390 RepID=A0A6P7G5N2_DIAVI